jgi:hypothetical protein
MKSLWLWILAGVAAIAFAVYKLTRPAAAAASTPASQVNTGTGGIISKFASTWTAFDSLSASNTAANQVQAQNALTGLTTLFQTNTPTQNGVSTTGSNFGAVQSAGSGAGVPTTGADTTNLYSDLDYLNPSPTLAISDGSDAADDSTDLGTGY